jgi:hypothetical protein
MTVSIDHVDEQGFRLRTGAFAVAYDTDWEAIRVTREDTDGTLTLSPGRTASATGPLASGAADSVTVEESETAVSVTVSTGRYRLELTCPRDAPGLVDTRLSVTTGADPDPLPEGAPELAVEGVTGDADESVVNYLDGTTDGSVETDDINEFVFVGLPDSLDATLFSAVDYGALDDFVASTDADMYDVVGKPPGRFGYTVPGTELPSDATIPVSATVLRLEPGALALPDPRSYTRRFVTALAAVYDRLSVPDTERIEWPDIAERGADDLAVPPNRAEHDGVWHPAGVELVSTMSVVNPYRRYADRFDADTAEAVAAPGDELLQTYYDPDFETTAGSAGVFSNTPEHRDLTHADTWYYLWGLIQVGEYARESGSPAAMEMFLDTADVVVDLGQAIDYEFPSWVDIEMLTGVDAAGSVDLGPQYDCAGAFIYLMLQYHDSTGDERYLREAEAAAEQLLDIGFEYPFELTTTALGPVALYWLYERTDDERYLDASYIPLASVLRYAYFFDPDYGEFDGRRVFLLNSAMSTGNYYANAIEEDALLVYLGRYLRDGFDDIDPAARDLVGELLRHKGSSLVDALAPRQPDPSLIADDIAPQSGRRANHEWYLPLEPFGVLGPDFDALGCVGQTLYGTGAFATAALLQYHSLTPDLDIYTECAVEINRDGPYAHELRPLGGDRPFRVDIEGSGEAIIDLGVTTGDGESVDLDYTPDEDRYRCHLHGGQRYRFSQTVPRRAVAVERLDVSPQQADPGEPVNIVADIRNTFPQGGHYTVEIQVGEETQTVETTLDGGDSERVETTATRSEAGCYLVKVQRTRARFEVVES